MTTSPGVQDASAASASLLGATEARDRLTGRAGWMRPFYLALGAGFVAVVLAVGFGSLTTIFVVTGLFVAAAMLLVVWALRQGVVRRGTSRLHVTTMVMWGVLYMAALQVGMNFFPGVPAFWFPAAAVVATPFVVAAVIAGHPGGVQ